MKLNSWKLRKLPRQVSTSKGSRNCPAVCTFRLYTLAPGYNRIKGSKYLFLNFQKNWGCGPKNHTPPFGGQHPCLLGAQEAIQSIQMIQVTGASWCDPVQILWALPSWKTWSKRHRTTGQNRGKPGLSRAVRRSSIPPEKTFTDLPVWCRYENPDHVPFRAATGWSLSCENLFFAC